MDEGPTWRRTWGAVTSACLGRRRPGRTGNDLHLGQALGAGDLPIEVGQQLCASRERFRNNRNKREPDKKLRNTRKSRKNSDVPAYIEPFRVFRVFRSSEKMYRLFLNRH